MTRRHFLNQAGLGPGAVALASLLDETLFASQGNPCRRQADFRPAAL